MNKLSSCELFTFVNNSFKGSILNTIQYVSEHLGKYTVEFDMYDFTVKAMRSYKYPLSKLIVNSALIKEVQPMLLLEPKNVKDQQIYLPASINAISTRDAKNGYVDISPRSKYVRNKAGGIDALKVKEVELYTYLQIGFLDLYLKRHAEKIDRSGVITKNVAIAYSRLFTKCIDRDYPVSANADKYNVSLFLSAVFCLVTFFNYGIEDAKNIIYSSGIANRNVIESDCKVIRENKLEFTGLQSFLEMYAYEFDEYIREGSLTIRDMVRMWIKMYGANSYFALEHSTSFINMILCIPIGLYNDKFITKAIKAQVDKIQESLVTTFGTSR